VTFVDVLMPACTSFGVLFLTASQCDNSWKKPALVRSIGVGMVTVALGGMWFTVVQQRGEISTLTLRMEALEARK
jgi:hypothetical protein